ncbi:MAG TPA: hypothetical protein VG650_02995 [Mycobacteriales bacterium]|nr:hypothetical protein [Mycobacteriales bacterium]
MQTNLAMRRLSGVALVAVAALGMGTVLAVPAAATATSLSAAPVQPRYPVSAQATISVTATGGVGDALTGSVISGNDVGAPVNCGTVQANGTASCTFSNLGSAGVDQVRIQDATPPGPTVSATTSVGFETITAVPDQNVGTALNPVYLYGTGESATIAVTVSGASNTPSLKGVVLPGSPDANTTLSCTQSPVQAASWTCTLANHGTAGADQVVIFDDDNPNGLNGQADSSEAQVALTVNFEQITGAAELARDGTPNGTIDVTVTGIPNVGGVPRTPNLKEVVRGGQFTTAGSCAAGPGPTNGRYSTTCTVSNGGRSDSAVIQIYDDLDGNASPGAGEPTTNVTLSFETITVTDPGAPHAPNSTATFDVTVTGVPAGSSPSIDYLINAGSTDTATPAGQAVLCNGAGASWTCQLPNTHQTATGTAVDNLTVFDDANNNRTLDTTPAPEASTTATITFGSAVTATPASATYPVFDRNNSGSGLATIQASVVAGVNTVPHLRWTVTNGPDADAAHTSQNCVPLNGGTTDWTCNFTNGGTAGLDTVVVYNDLNFAQFGNGETAAQAAFVATDPNDVVKADFQAPQTVTLTPTLAPNQHQAAIATGGCQVYTVDVAPGLRYPVSISASEGLPAGSSSNPFGSSAPPAALSTCSVPNGSDVTTTSNTVTSSGGTIPILSTPTYTNTMVLSSFTGQDPAHPGRVIFGLSSSQTGTVTVSARTSNATAANNASSPAQSMSVVAGGQSAVKSLTATPASQTGVANGSLAYTVLAQDANGTPLNGVTIDYVINAGDPDATTAAVACAVADQFGNAKCTVKNSGKTGLDHITFFAPQATGETAPTASDPQTAATGTFQAAPPAGSTMSLTCPDELLTDANQLVPNCTVTTGSGGTQQIIFVAHISGPSGEAVANIPVQFTLVNAPTGVTGSTAQVSTNAKGNALFVVSAANPSAGEKITVQSVVGDPSHGGLGPDTAVATFQAPHPSVVSLTPHSQKVRPGGLVTLAAHVTDQFGVGIAGQSLSYAVSGRNNGSGTAVTGSGGSATISYVDSGSSGSDTISVLDVSADAPSTGNPASAVVTFGSGGGCSVNCGGGGAKEHPSMSVHQSSARGDQSKLKLIVTSHPRLVGAKVTFYQISKNGTRHKIGNGTTGTKGKVTGTLKAASGLHLRFQAKVKGRAGVRTGYSNVVKVHVH